MLIRQELDFFAWEGLDGRAGARGAMGRHAPRAGRGGVEGGGTHPLYIYIDIWFTSSEPLVLG